MTFATGAGKSIQRSSAGKGPRYPTGAGKSTLWSSAGKVPRDPTSVGKSTHPADPTGTGRSTQRSSVRKSITRAIFWSYRVNLLRLWEVENCYGSSMPSQSQSQSQIGPNCRGAEVCPSVFVTYENVTCSHDQTKLQDVCFDISRR